jgi:hypothetical protein
MSQEMAKKHTVLFLFGTINEGNAYLMLAVASEPPVYTTSQFL